MITLRACIKISAYSLRKSFVSHPHLTTTQPISMSAIFLGTMVSVASLHRWR
jgi:hypothetical protein